MGKKFLFSFLETQCKRFINSKNEHLGGKLDIFALRKGPRIGAKQRG